MLRRIDGDSITKTIGVRRRAESSGRLRVCRRPGGGGARCVFIVETLSSYYYCFCNFRLNVFIKFHMKTIQRMRRAAVTLYLLLLLLPAIIFVVVCDMQAIWRYHERQSNRLVSAANKHYYLFPTPPTSSFYPRFLRRHARFRGRDIIYSS